MNKFELIRGAFNRLSIPFSEDVYYSDIAYRIADKEFDNIMYTAFGGTNISVNQIVATLNVSVDEPVVYKGRTYTPYMLPEDFLFLVDKPTNDIFFGRNRIYREGTGEFTIQYCKTNDITKISPLCNKYLEYFLASELASVLQRGSKQRELFEMAQFHLQQLKEAEIYMSVDVFDNFSVDIY
jgi:hypothetical protein